MEEEYVCRTCFELFPKCDLTSINEVQDDMKSIREKLLEYLPEVTVDIVADPLVCEYCISTIRLAYQFKNICFQGEKVLYKFIKNKSAPIHSLLTTEDLLSIVHGNFAREHCYSSSRRALAIADSSDSENVSEQEKNEKSTSPQNVQAFLKTTVQRIQIGKTSTDVTSEPIIENGVNGEAMDVENELSLNHVKTPKKASPSSSKRKYKSNTKDKALFDSNNSESKDSSIDAATTDQVYKMKDISKLTKESDGILFKEEPDKEQINHNKRNAHSTPSPKRSSIKIEKQSIKNEQNDTELQVKQSPSDCLEVVLETDDINKENTLFNVKTPTKNSKPNEIHITKSVKSTEKGNVSMENQTHNKSKSKNVSSTSIQNNKVKDSTLKPTTSKTSKKRITSKTHLKRNNKMHKLKRSLSIRNKVSIPKTNLKNRSSNGTHNQLFQDSCENNELDIYQQDMNEILAGSQSNIGEAQMGGDGLTCNTCNKNFIYKSQYDVHVKSHIFQKLFSCPVCEKDFSQEKYLQQHALTHTTRTGPYQCDICHKILSATTALKRHQRTHTGEKPFSCPTCEKPFAQKVQLRVHMRIHAGVKPFTCGTCGAGFTQKSHLLGHVRIHTGEKPYKCDICPKSFRKLPGLQIHQESHRKKPFQCYVCNFLFKDPQVFTKHVNKHVASLAKAGSSFVNNSTNDGDTNHGMDKKLLEELIKYSPYYCSICDKHFFNALSLRRHTVRHHTTN